MLCFHGNHQKVMKKRKKKSDIEVIVIQERNKEKLHLIEQFETDMVVTLHVHNTSEEKEKVYYKENGKSKKIVKKMFDPINYSFQVKSKKTKKYFKRYKPDIYSRI